MIKYLGSNSKSRQCEDERGSAARGGETLAEYWKGKGYEKGESQKFWLSLLTDVFGVEHAAEYIMFEDSF